MLSGQIITTSAEVTPNGGLERESPPNPLNSGLGIIVICPDVMTPIWVFPKNRGKTPKMDGLFHGKPYEN